MIKGRHQPRKVIFTLALGRSQLQSHAYVRGECLEKKLPGSKKTLYRSLRNIQVTGERLKVVLIYQGERR